MEPFDAASNPERQTLPVRQLPLIFYHRPGTVRRELFALAEPAEQQIRHPGIQQPDLAIPKSRSAPETPLLEIERDRIVFNMQMSVLTFIIRQARECQDKMEQVEILYKGQQNS
ncbi:Protein of uncharacterised function (DUF3158) [Salmonella enterica subsp. arizonae]|uniref:Protein of uncharacterized function (DUF3158) n=1 Tax=Salmonella enterica subsp. arizonae TaxID=59203 RepID=A0A379TI23_SALER|nr:Protein of uncharacterised function (DUF3158) [Salmonella enterica subsp. arizonae]